MEPLFTFLAGYWWLAFPAFGLLAAAGNGWERRARRRHRQKLEILKAQGELKAAQSTTPGPAQVAAASTTPAPETVDDESPAAQLEKLFAAHDDVTHRWLEYELDVAKLIAFPAMSDGRQPLTAAFLRAKRVADNARPAEASAKVGRERLLEYRDAVTDYEVAFDLAERDARRIKDSTFSSVERKRLDTAQQLLSVAVDQAATPAERQIAYKRVREELDGLISLSDDAVDRLEKKVALEITPGTPRPPHVPRPDTPAS
ncbi:hypothetical protein R2Q81_05815 [Microbacterium aquimaris]|uniref:hypothetical protein n=1 Tax=Microbacterium aquimaris TaxID=459816 RepID=UPI002AD31ED3|nr:hypothetical protein [Microbacterium aquimaris]MDZ8275468.1 hypothetical protein [Microbacterium aquimaris]